MNKDIQQYNDSLPEERKAICELLMQTINAGLSTANSKVWHGSPVWFLEDNPIVGYANRKNHIQLLFWSGQSFDESGLSPEGSFKAAEKRYTQVSDLNIEQLHTWLKKSENIQWDYKNIVKRRGVLERLV